MNAKVKNVTKTMNKKTSCSWIKLVKVRVFSEQYEIPYVRRKYTYNFGVFGIYFI